MCVGVLATELDITIFLLLCVTSSSVFKVHLCYGMFGYIC